MGSKFNFFSKILILLPQTVVLMCGMPILGENSPKVHKNGPKWPFMAIYDLGFGHRDPKMDPSERPRPDGRFDVRQPHTWVKFPRKVPKMAQNSHLWPFMTSVLVIETRKQLRVITLVQTFVLMCGMPILCEIFRKSTKVYPKSTVV